MQDLYQIFQQRLAARVTSLHPHRWFTHVFGNGPGVFDCRMQYRPLFSLKEFTGAPLAVVGGIEIKVAQNGPPLAQNGFQALRVLGRQSRDGVYLAHPRLAWVYAMHRPFAVQDAFKDFLKERVPSLQLEVRSLAGIADGVTPRAVFEVARIISWKQALGQLLAYALGFPGRQRVLYLFGPTSHPRQLHSIRSICHQYSCHVAYTRCDDQSFGPKTTRRFLAPPRPPEIHGCEGTPEECPSMHFSDDGALRSRSYEAETLDAIEFAAKRGGTNDSGA